MNRRNVLGNRIEENKSCWIVLIGILITALQCVINYCIGEEWLRVLLFVLSLLVSTVVVHLLTGELGELFTLLLVPSVFFGALGVAVPYLSGEILPAAQTALTGALVAWLVPVLYAIIFAWIEGYSVMEEFAGFYWKSAIFFYIIYFGIIIFSLFSAQTDASELRPTQMIPFATFAAYIDGLVKKTVTVSQLMTFLVDRIVFFIPYGFFVAMVGRKLHGALRVLLLAAFPMLLELLEMLLGISNFDMDDVIFSFLGSLLGMIAFFVFNTLFQNITNRNFDGSEINRDYYGRKI